MRKPQDFLAQSGADAGGDGMDNFLGQAIGSSSSENFNGDLVQIKDESLDEFIRLVVAEQPFLQRIARTRLEGDRRELPNLNMQPGQLAGNLGMMEKIDGTNADEAEVEYGGRILEVKPYDLRFKYETTNFPRINIEGAGMRNTIDEVTRDYLGNEQERIFLNSRTSGVNHSSWSSYNTGNMTTIDGVYALALAGAHIYNPDPTGAGDAYISPAILKDMWQLLPTKWRTQKQDFVYFCSSNFQLEYVDYFGRRQTSLGDSALTQGAEGSWNNIPLAPIPAIPDDARHVSQLRPNANTDPLASTGPDYGTDYEYAWTINGEAGYTPTDATENYTWVLLTRPENIVAGYGPEMRVTVRPDDGGKYDWYNFWGQFGIQFFNIDEVVLAINITPDVDPSLPDYVGSTSS